MLVERTWIMAEPGRAVGRGMVWTAGGVEKEVRTRARWVRGSADAESVWVEAMVTVRLDGCLVLDYSSTVAGAAMITTDEIHDLNGAR